MKKRKWQHLILLAAALGILLLVKIIRPATTVTALILYSITAVLIFLCCSEKQYRLRSTAASVIYIILSVCITLFLIDFALNALSMVTSGWISGSSQQEFESMEHSMYTVEDYIRNAPQFCSVGIGRFVPAFIQRIMPIASLGFDKQSFTYTIVDFFTSIPGNIADWLWSLIAEYIAIPAWHLYQGTSGTSGLVLGIAIAAAAILGIIMFVVLPVMGYVLWRQVILILLCLGGSIRYYCLYRMHKGKRDIHFVQVFQASLKCVMNDEKESRPKFIQKWEQNLDAMGQLWADVLEDAVDYLLYPLIHFVTRIRNTLASGKTVLLLIYETAVCTAFAYGIQCLHTIDQSLITCLAAALAASSILVLLLNQFAFHLRKLLLAIADAAPFTGMILGAFTKADVLTISFATQMLALFIVLYVIAGFQEPLRRYRRFFNYDLSFRMGKARRTPYRSGKAALIAAMLFLSWVFLRWPVTLKGEYTGLADDYENPISSIIVTAEEGVMEVISPILVPEYYTTDAYRSWKDAYGYTAYPRLHYINNHSYATIYRTWYRDVEQHYSQIRAAETQNSFQFPLTICGCALTLNRIFLFANLGFLLIFYFLLDEKGFRLQHQKTPLSLAAADQQPDSSETLKN